MGAAACGRGALALQLIASRSAKLAWSRGLMITLLGELNIDAVFTDLVGRPSGVPTRRYPQAIVVALALRHSWRRDEVIEFARRLGVRHTDKDLREAELADGTDGTWRHGRRCESINPKPPFNNERC